MYIKTSDTRCITIITIIKKLYNMKRTFLFVALLLIFSGAALAKKGPKNIIIMIGDGMGINQVQAAYTSNGGYLNMTDRCPYSGLRRTNSASDYITDSAAGGTAIATGVKTKNNMVGMSPDTVPLNSIIRLATLKGLSTGVICRTSAPPVYARGDSRRLSGKRHYSFYRRRKNAL